MKHSVTLTINSGVPQQTPAPGVFTTGALDNPGEPSMTLDIESQDRAFIHQMFTRAIKSFEDIVEQWRLDYGIKGTVTIEQAIANEFGSASPLSVVVDDLEPSDMGNDEDDEIPEDD